MILACGEDVATKLPQGLEGNPQDGKRGSGLDRTGRGIPVLAGRKEGFRSRQNGKRDAGLGRTDREVSGTA